MKTMYAFVKRQLDSLLWFSIHSDISKLYVGLYLSVQHLRLLHN